MAHIARWQRKLAAAALLAALCSVLPGCEMWNAWLDFLKWKGSTKSNNDAPLAPPNSIAKTSTPATPGNPNMLVPRVTVFRITVPIGQFSGNEKIWSQLNEDALDSKTSVLMAQNGLRAGTGQIARWSSIAAMLDVPGSSTDQIVMQTDGRSSTNVLTRSNIAEQIVMSVDRDLQQQLREFENCDNGFRLSLRSVKNKPELTVQLEPVVTLGAVQIVRPGAGMGVKPNGFSSEEGFEDLRMAAALKAEQFLAVSPMDPKVSPFSVGTLWLSDRDKVPATETVLVFVPGGK